MVKGITEYRKENRKTVCVKAIKAKGKKFPLNFVIKNEVILKALSNSEVYSLAWEGTQEWLLKEIISVSSEIISLKKKKEKHLYSDEYMGSIRIDLIRTPIVRL